LSRIVGARSIRLVEGQRIDHTVAVTLRPKAAVHAEFALPGVAPKRRRIGGRLTSLIDGL
jgi:hypothetical protein